MSTFSGSFKLLAQIVEERTHDLLALRQALESNGRKEWTVGHGTAANQINALYSDQLTVPAVTGLTIDLQALTDAFGVAMTFIKLKGMLITVPSDAETNLAIKPGASNGLAAFVTGTTPAIIVMPNGAVALMSQGADGYTVDGTHKTILFEHVTGAKPSFDINITLFGVKS